MVFSWRTRLASSGLCLDSEVQLWVERGELASSPCPMRQQSAVAVMTSAVWEMPGHLPSSRGRTRLPFCTRWQPTAVFLPGEPHGRRSLVGCSPWGHKELDTTEQLNWTKLKVTIQKILSSESSLMPLLQLLAQTITDLLPVTLV